ncbi:hypothetical protein ACOME3_005588 [Neoechinorhynchus agilis]
MSNRDSTIPLVTDRSLGCIYLHIKLDLMLKKSIGILCGQNSVELLIAEATNDSPGGPLPKQLAELSSLSRLNEGRCLIMSALERRMLLLRFGQTIRSIHKCILVLLHLVLEGSLDIVSNIREFEMQFREDFATIIAVYANHSIKSGDSDLYELMNKQLKELRMLLSDSFELTIRRRVALERRPLIDERCGVSNIHSIEERVPLDNKIVRNRRHSVGRFNSSVLKNCRFNKNICCRRFFDCAQNYFFTKTSSLIAGHYGWNSVHFSDSSVPPQVSEHFNDPKEMVAGEPFKNHQLIDLDDDDPKDLNDVD